jgi:hypothetical protein
MVLPISIVDYDLFCNWRSQIALTLGNIVGVDANINTKTTI